MPRMHRARVARVGGVGVRGGLLVFRSTEELCLLWAS